MAAAIGLGSALAPFSGIAGGTAAFFPRHPAPSPDGERVAFSYAGDIWTVPVAGGRAVRLTVHPAYEHTPRWSPDGEWLAFSADRFGDDDVFVIPAEGGQSRRLTFLDSDDHVCSWTPDGASILFASNRDDIYPDYQLIYRVPFVGGTPERVGDVYGSEAAPAPGGDEILLTVNGGQWWRKGYISSGAAAVWRFGFTGESIQPETGLPLSFYGPRSTGGDFLKSTARWPMWAFGGAVFADEKDGTMNLWMTDNGDRMIQLTKLVGDGVRFPSASWDGSLIAFEYQTDIYTLNRERQLTRMEITAPLDDPDAFARKVRYNDKAQRVAIAPGADELVVEVRGELFAGRIVEDEFKAARGAANPLTGMNPARDGDFDLSPGGDSLLFVSDRNGGKDIYLLWSAEKGAPDLARARRFNLKRLTNGPSEEFRPRWSPDGKRFAFVRGTGDLVVMEVKGGVERTILTGWSTPRFQWSPDGRWLAFSREDDEYNSDVWVIPSDGGTAVNISRHPDEDDAPVWSGDGRKLAFRSRRRDNNWDIYFAFLRHDDALKSDAEWAEAALAKKKPEKNGDEEEEKKRAKPPKPEPLTVTIDTVDIFRRVRPITQLAGEEGAFAISNDGEWCAFTSDHEGERDLYRIHWTGRDMERLTNGGQAPSWVRFAPDDKSVWFLTSAGQVKRVKPSGGKVEDLPFTAEVTVVPSAEREQKFEEAWRILNDQFYDPDFHGHDWSALRDKYRPLALGASCEKDFGDIMRLMMGELNASHMGYYSPRSGDNRQSGRLGLDFRPRADDAAGLIIESILPFGPCDRTDADVQVGDRLVAVDGDTLIPTANLYQFLDDKVGRAVELLLRRGGKAIRTTVTPISRWRLSELRYDQWVLARRDAVHRMTDGKIGYIHIRGMGEPSLARFETELFSEGSGRSGLVIDVRHNGGGWTTDYLLAMLQVRRHAVTYPRGGGPGYPQGRLPLYAWTKPIVALCNEHSFSNAEIFSHAMKTLGRGKLVGVPTPGGVISTDRASLIDGSAIRVPLRGWFVGPDPTPDPRRRMEGNGAVPDVIIDLHPSGLSSSDDGQLKAAVEVILGELNKED